MWRVAAPDTGYLMRQFPFGSVIQVWMFPDSSLQSCFNGFWFFNIIITFTVLWSRPEKVGNCRKLILFLWVKSRLLKNGSFIPPSMPHISLAICGYLTALCSVANTTQEIVTLYFFAGLTESEIKATWRDEWKKRQCLSMIYEGKNGQLTKLGEYILN